MGYRVNRPGRALLYHCFASDGESPPSRKTVALATGIDLGYSAPMDVHSHYQSLSPDIVLDAVENLGFLSNGRILALNSYENRVYQIGLEEGAEYRALVAKFYRPERWTDEAIEEEHQFTLDLVAQEVPVVAPLAIKNETLHRFNEFRFAVYPSVGGRWPDLDNLDNLFRLGRYIARIHRDQPFDSRVSISVDRFGWQSSEYLLQHDFLPDYIKESYAEIIKQILRRVEQVFQSINYRAIALHGDCHPGNILWTESGPMFVDFDDCMTGPAVQDIWMLLSGERSEMIAQLSEIVEGYSEFREFDLRELPLIEPLRALRMIHYAAWLARRWTDPAFPRSFPWFNTQRYWEEHILSLQEQLSLLNEPPLTVS